MPRPAGISIDQRPISAVPGGDSRQSSMPLPRLLFARGLGRAAFGIAVALVCMKVPQSHYDNICPMDPDREFAGGLLLGANSHVQGCALEQSRGCAVSDI